MKGDEKLCLLRILMKDKGYDAYIIPHGDQHDNEYIAEADERIKFISNFSGSNGIGLVTKDVALMWTDGRYYIQIEKELYPGWKMKKIEFGEESLSDYIYNNLSKKTKIGMDFSLFTQSRANQIKNKLFEYEFIDDKENIIDTCWGKLKPKYNCNKVLILPEEYTGKSVLDKYKEVDEKIEQII
jgi:Xaa-Pro aminopeptidase